MFLKEKKKGNNTLDGQWKLNYYVPTLQLNQSYPLLPCRLHDGTRKLSVLLRIKISSKSYGRLQTNRAVAFPTGCRNFRRLSTFLTVLTTASHSTTLRSNTFFLFSLLFFLRLPSSSDDDLQSKAIMLFSFFSFFWTLSHMSLLYNRAGK